jgi:hypothetical protein
MGEGWSDWYALVITMKPGDSEELPRGIANYYRGNGPLGGGVREYPYTTDIALNPLTYDSIKTVGIPHGVGTVWSAMLWEMTWGLVNEYGFDPNLTNFTGDINQDAGNVMAMAIVTGQPLQKGDWVLMLLKATRDISTMVWSLMSFLLVQQFFKSQKINYVMNPLFFTTRLVGYLMGVFITAQG